ncbi:MAG: alpha/beta fold hydrolase [Christensenellales bacterium]
MVKKLLIILICIALLFVFLSGCQALQHYAKQMMNTEEYSGESFEALPTLAVKDNTELIPLDVLTSYVEYTPPQISDDGSMILYRHLTEFEDNIIAENWQTGEQTVVNWPSESAGNPYFLWAPDGETVLFFVDNMGDENYGLYTSNINTGQTKTIFAGGSNDCYIISDNPDNEQKIFILIFNFDTKVYDLYSLNYITGSKELVLANPGNITNYIFDRSGNLRLVETTDSMAGKQVWLKKEIRSSYTDFAENEYEKIFSWDYEDADSSKIYGFMQDGRRILYVDSSSTNTTALCIYDIGTGETTKIFNDPDYDIAGTWTNIEHDQVTAVSVYSQTIEWHVLDESFNSDYQALSVIGDVFDIFDSSEEDKYWLVSYISDKKEKDYYVYDMEAKQITFLFNAQPKLEQFSFAPMEPFAFISGDGLTIEGYATFPVGAVRENLPTVVLVHGGPWTRDIWGYNSEVQFLANRGYLVLQINFRGSAGYGKDFLLAGDKEWGGLMHQDILDAVSFSTSQGWTDPGCVGVYGASYGGYEALICAAFSSDVFECAVDAFGPSSLLTFVESIPAQWTMEYQDLIRAVGDPLTEAEFMKQRSPLYYADDINIPLLIVQGENDVRVSRQESDQMVAALKGSGVPVIYMLFPNTGHGFNTNASRQEFFSMMERFLAQNLGGRTE